MDIIGDYISIYIYTHTVLETYIYTPTFGSLKLNPVLSSLCKGTAEKSHKSRQYAAMRKHIGHVKW